MQNTIKDFWKDNFNDFVILKNKIPSHKLNQFKTWDEVKDEDEIGIIIPKPFVVIDIDDQEESLLFKKIVDSLNIKCLQIKTKRGIHFWFKSDEIIPNWIHKPNAFGIKCDVRSWGKICFAKIKDKEWRENLTPNIININEIDYLWKMLKPISNKLLNDLPCPINWDEGDGRRDALFSRIIPLANEKFTKNEVIEVFNVINNLVFKTPINHYEFENLFTDEEIWEKYNEGKPYWYVNQESGKKIWKHDLFALYLHEMFNGVKKDGLYWVYCDNKYQTGKILLEELMIEELSSIKINQRNEVRSYLNALPPKFNHEVIDEAKYIGVKNGVLDVENEILYKHDSKYFIQTYFDCSYIKEVNTEYVDKILRDLANQDKNIHLLLEEVMGYILLKDQRFQVAFIALGEGSNGKSTFIKMITNMVGIDNVSAIDYTQVTEKFKIAGLLNKVLNVGEEMPNKLTKQPEIFKKLITGDPVQAEFKNENTFVLRNKAKFIFSANELPPTTDRTHGFYRRWIIIPFNAKFDNNNRDLNLDFKMKEEGFKNAVLKVALRGLNRLLKQNHFTQCELVDKMMHTYQIDNNSTLRFIEESIIKIDAIIDRDVISVFKDYKEFCLNYGFQNLSLPKFQKEILKYYNELEIKSININGLWIKQFKKNS